MPAFKEIIFPASIDDVLAIVDQFKGLQGRNLSDDLMSEMIRNAKVLCDYSEHEHHEALLQNNQIPITLGLMLALGYKGEGSHRDFGSTIAWMTLQLRSCANMMSFLAREIQNPDRSGRMKRVSGTTDAGGFSLIPLCPKCERTRLTGHNRSSERDSRYSPLLS